MKDSKFSELFKAFLIILGLNGFDSTSYLQFPQSPSLTLGDCSKISKYNLYQLCLQLSQHFQFSGKIQAIVYTSFSFISTLWCAWMVKSTRCRVIFFLLINTRSCLLSGIGWVVLSLSPWAFYTSHFLDQINVWIYHLSALLNFSLEDISQRNNFPALLCQFVIFWLIASFL